MGDPLFTREARARFDDHFGEVRRTARWLVRRVGPAIALDDLCAYGAEGLFQAARRYRPDRGVHFRSYARTRVLGAMLDGLRAHAPERRALLHARRVAERSDPLGRETRDVEGGAAALRTLERHSVDWSTAVARGIVPAVAMGDEGEWIPVSRERDPEASLAAAELRALVARAIAELSEAEAAVVRGHLLADEPVESVARGLGISACRAHQLLRRALGRLERRLRGALFG